MATADGVPFLLLLAYYLLMFFILLLASLLLMMFPLLLASFLYGIPVVAGVSAAANLIFAPAFSGISDIAGIPAVLLLPAAADSVPTVYGDPVPLWRACLLLLVCFSFL
jgi:hypothetical protein